MRLDTPQKLQQVLWLTPRRGGLALALGFSLLLAGCGQITRLGSASPPAMQSATQSATQSPSAGNGATANGCPTKQLPAPGGVFHPDVIVTSSEDLGAMQPIALTQGQRLEIRLDPTIQWSLTNADPAHVLQSSAPEGWYDATSNACVWRFVAVSAGSAQLTFGGLVLCRPANVHCVAATERATFAVTVH
jgi:hypothetical protein